MKQQYEVFSIESRKGGVGKTTMALNLSKALLDRGYKVLFIDCDISGTPISNAVEKSVFWNKFINAGHEANGGFINLMKLFVDRNRSQAVNVQDIIKSIEYKLDKINIISSDIYGIDGSLIMDPRHLMDEMNSYWLMCMLKEIADSFACINEQITAIVIDNSPGYVGLGKSIRDWLTSLGPKYAHFLLVSSLDVQDVEATICSAEEIYGLMDSKIKLARVDENPEIVTNIDELMASESSLGQFYYSLSDNHPFVSSKVKDNNVCEYVSIVFNKVPVSLLDGNVSYKMPSADTLLREQLQNELIGLDDKGFPVNIIGYDAMLSEQFISSNIVVVGNEYKNFKEKFAEREVFANSMLDEGDKVRVANSLGRSFSSLTKSLWNGGFKALSKAFQQQANPNWSLLNLWSQTRDVTNYVMFEKDVLNESTIEPILLRNYQCLSEFIERKGLSEYSAVLFSLVDEMHRKATSTKKHRSNPRLLANMSVLLRMFFMVIDQEFMEEERFYDYAISEYNSNTSIKRDWIKFLPEESFVLCRNIEASKAGMEGMLNGIFKKFYKAFLFAFIKLNDSVFDYMLLLNAFKNTLQSESPRLIKKELRDYVSMVVVSKNLKYNDEVFKQLAEKPFEMKDIQNTINEKILRQWI